MEAMQAPQQQLPAKMDLALQKPGHNTQRMALVECVDKELRRLGSWW